MRCLKYIQFVFIVLSILLGWQVVDRIVLGEELMTSLEVALQSAGSSRKELEKVLKESDGYGIPTGIMGFSDVQVTDSAIYAVFHGTPFKEIARQSGRLPDGGKYIYVFRLKGEPMCKYVLDHYIYGIWVDEANKMIIATDVNNDQPILKFSFG